MHRLSTKEAAEVLGYSADTLRHWRMGQKVWQPGLGPRFGCINGRIFYTSASLDIWMRAYADPDGIERTQADGEVVGI